MASTLVNIYDKDDLKVTVLADIKSVKLSASNIDVYVSIEQAIKVASVVNDYQAQRILNG